MTINALTAALERTLKSHGFTTSRELTMAGTRFDLVAEDETRLLFITTRSRNAGWLDDFYDQQAALNSTMAQLDLGPKWRDVYLLEITTDAIDSGREFQVAEAIESNTSTARKLVLDAAGLDPTNENDIDSLLSPILTGPELGTPSGDIDVFPALREHLVAEGLPERSIDRLLTSYTKDRHDCVKLLLEDIAVETQDD